jgi:Haem-binding domain
MSNMIRKLIPTLAAAAILAAGCSLIYPFGNPSSRGAKTPVLSGAEIEPETLGLIQRACQNCHSLNTELPLYGRIAPMSWLMARDVQQARLHMNLSQWQEYSAEDRIMWLSEVGSAVKNREMPVQRYVLLHSAREQRPAIGEPRLHGGDRSGGDAIAIGEGEPAHPGLILAGTRLMRDPCLDALAHPHCCRGRTGEGGADRHIVDPRLMLVEAQRIRDQNTARGSGIDMDGRLVRGALCHRYPRALAVPSRDESTYIGERPCLLYEASFT